MREKIIIKAKEILAEKIKVAFDAMQAAQASANEEGKSSAGDKYETARAMGQIERDMHARQYEKLRAEMTILERIDAHLTTKRVVLGSLVATSAGTFFISISLGIINIDSNAVIVVSAQSPVGMSLLGQEVGDAFVFQQKKCVIEGLQ
jgi:transcription elongation GreA/GreB family factor